MKTSRRTFLRTLALGSAAFSPNLYAEEPGTPKNPVIIEISPSGGIQDIRDFVVPNEDDINHAKIPPITDLHVLENPVPLKKEDLEIILRKHSPPDKEKIEENEKISQEISKEYSRNLVTLATTNREMQFISAAGGFFIAPQFFFANYHTIDDVVGGKSMLYQVPFSGSQRTSLKLNRDIRVLAYSAKRDIALCFTSTGDSGIRIPTFASRRPFNGQIIYASCRSLPEKKMPKTLKSTPNKRLEVSPMKGIGLSIEIENGQKILIAKLKSGFQYVICKGHAGMPLNNGDLVISNITDTAIPKHAIRGYGKIEYLFPGMAEVEPGYSGFPVFTSKKEILGPIVGTSEDVNRAFMAIPETPRDFLEQYQKIALHT